MKKIFACVWALLLSGVVASSVFAAQTMPSTTPHLAGASLHGQSRLRVIVHVYDTALYVPAGFVVSQAFAQPIALAIRSARTVKAHSLVGQIMKELKRQALPVATLAKYEAELTAVMPAAQPGDTLTGVYTPSTGWALYFKDQRLAQWNDEAFGKAFFNIWLGEQTSELGMRSDLLKLK